MTVKDKSRAKSTLIVIGGHEDRKGEMEILKEVARRVGDGKLAVTTVASHKPEGYFEEYEKAFTKLGLKDILNLEITTRAEASLNSRQQIIDKATAVFFTGGDQLKITSQIGDTPIFRRICEIYTEGGVIAGTSAGASVMCETMLVSGESNGTYRYGDNLRMAPGLGLFKGVIVDQHFAERGRMGRLLAAVAQNPRILGLGIDEATAIIVEDEKEFSVIGEGAVYVVDGSAVTSSNIAEANFNEALSIYDVKLHVLNSGDTFDLRERRPGSMSRRTAAEVQVKEAETTPESG